MTQQEKYALHLPYGVLVIYANNVITKVTELSFDKPFLFVNKYLVSSEKVSLYIESAKPLLRNLSDLTKSITQKDYNDGKPFVPVLEISKMNLGHIDWITREREHWVEEYSYYGWLGRIPFHIIQQLLKWHFAIGFEQSEYIEVTNENNPY